jgi:hypothetical protein
MKPTMLGTAVDEAGGVMASAVRVGRLVGLTGNGEPVVDFAGNSGEPVVARMLASAETGRTRGEPGADVLLVFEEGDPSRPIVLGFLRQRPPEEPPLATGVLERNGADAVTVDGRTVEITGRERIVLACGKSSITLLADGRVIVKGTRLVSRASESNKIKGATIALN